MLNSHLTFPEIYTPAISLGRPKRSSAYLDGISMAVMKSSSSVLTSQMLNTHLLFLDPYFKQLTLAVEKKINEGVLVFSKENTPTETEKLHWPPLENRRKIKRLCFLQSHQQTLTSCNTRICHSFRWPYKNTRPCVYPAPRQLRALQE